MSFISSVFRLAVALSVLVLALSACVPATPAVDAGAQMTQAVQTALASMLATRLPATPVDTATPIATPTILRTPPVLPSTFAAASLNPLDTPHTYIQDSCQYLKDKWTSTNSAPGTVVMAIMIHGINKGAAESSNQISAEDFKKLVNDLHDAGFQAITAPQMADFLEHNAKIPVRSVILIQDDRHYKENFDDHFRPLWEQWGWPMVSGWISANDSIRTASLPGNLELNAEGWVDYESHGVVHAITMNDSSTDEYIKSELGGSIADLQQNFHKTPVAIIWPGGDFGLRPVQFARQFGYRIGFTINPRGPVMFNWVPLDDQKDPQRPSFLPEGSVNDPLMVLPRYWDTDARTHIDEVRQIGNEAAAYAEQNKTTELDYYSIVCAPKLGPIP